MEQKKRAWLYCRIDAPEDVHGALKGQRKELSDYAEQMGLEITGVSEDTGSVLDFEQPGLREVMKAAGDGKMDVLLVKRLNRICRDMVKTIEFLWTLDQLGIKLYSSLEGEIRLEYHSPSLSPQ